MSRKIRILGIVPARGGSKGIKGKNIIDLGGMPLIAHTLISAKGSLLDDVIVSTDSESVKEVAERYGATVVIRPPEIARDETPTFDVLKYHLNNGFSGYDFVMILQPTSPFRSREDIDQAISLCEDGSEVISFSEVDEHPFYMYRILEGKMTPLMEESKNFLRRQDFPKCYIRNGVIYLLDAKKMLKREKILPDSFKHMIIPKERAVNIDTMDDLELARYMIRRN